MFLEVNKHPFISADNIEGTSVKDLVRVTT
jgi:hypothetical protein